MITIVDYGVGNTGSVKSMLAHIGVLSTISSDLKQIAQPDKLILPGVGKFDHAMTQCRAVGLDDVLSARVLTDAVPILGICLGMQMLTCGSEEGDLPGFGWINGIRQSNPPILVEWIGDLLGT